MHEEYFKPCPFCGSKEVLKRKVMLNEQVEYITECQKCFCIVQGWGETRDDEPWNQRDNEQKTNTNRRTKMNKKETGAKRKERE